MKKLYLLLFILVITVISAKANPVSQSKARTIAEKFFASHGQANAKLSVVGNTASSAKSTSGINTSEPSYYIFNNTEGKGYVLVSGDDAMPELLGYSFNGSWPTDEDDIPTPLTDALKRYSAFVETLRDGTTTIPDGLSSTTTTAQPVVGPLLTTAWDQSYPYNKYAPEIPAGKIKTKYNNHFKIGCVATALGQFINYWGKKTGNPVHPQGGETFATYTNFYNESGKVTKDTIPYTISSETTYDYSNYPDSICISPDSTQWMTKEEWETKGEAVALFMRDVAFALQTVWAIDGGGSSYAMATASVAAKYFGFSTDADVVTMTGERRLAEQKYLDMIKKNLDNEMPIIVGGSLINGLGHCFLFDGYDTNNFVHVNWGWGGLCNDWFDPGVLLVNVFDDKEETTYDFSYDNVLILNLHPKAEGEGMTISSTALQLNQALVGTSNKYESQIIYLLKSNANKPVIYLDRYKDNISYFYAYYNYFKFFDTNYKYVLADAQDNVVKIDTFTQYAPQGKGLNINPNTTYYQPLVLPATDGQYAIQGAVRLSSGNVSGSWTTNEQQDTILLEGEHVILNPETYNQYYHAQNCMHHIQSADNRFLAHLEYKQDPEQLVAGDSLDILFTYEGYANKDLQYDQNATSAPFILTKDGEEKADTLFDSFGKTLPVKTYFANYGFYLGLVSTPKAITFTEPGTYHLTFYLPMLNESLTNDITIKPTTGIQAVNATAPRSQSPKSYNTLGQCIGTDYHGIVIKNGKKYILK